MPSDRDHRASPAEDTTPPGGSPAPSRRRRLFSGPLTVEAYLRANNPPHYMQRLREMETQFQDHRRRLDEAYRALVDACGDDLEEFSSRWRTVAWRWRFDELNELIREHNRWYPAEASLPMDPRTGDYVPVHGASYRRKELGAKWILDHLPARPREGASPPRLPRRVPREPVGSGSSQGSAASRRS